MKNHTLYLALLICFSGSVYSQNEENPWLFEFGINSVNAEESEKTGYKLPTLSLSRYIFNNFSVGINYSENDVNVSNEDLYYFSLDGIIKYNIPGESMQCVTSRLISMFGVLLRHHSQGCLR